MSDAFDPEVPETPDDEKVWLPKSDLQQLRTKARRAEDAERKLAFAEAGIPLGDPRAGYFVKGYDGELNPEAIKTTWESTFGPPQESAVAPSVPADEQAAHARMAAAAAGAEAPKTTLTVDDLSRASSPEEVLRMTGELGMLASRE